MDELLPPEVLAQVELALRELAHRSGFGHVVVHFERGRAVSVTIHESRKLSAIYASVTLDPPAA